MYVSYTSGKFNSDSMQQSTGKTITWKRPPDDFIKLNFDGSVKSDSTASAGFILRNTDGNPLLASSNSCGKSNVLCAEAFALRAGLYAALLNGHKKIMVEGDSKIVIDCLNNKCSIPWKILSIIKDIQTLAKLFSEISFTHIWREANFAADAVANIGQEELRALSWTSDFPPQVRKAVLFDLLNIGCIRGASL